MSEGEETILRGAVVDVGPGKATRTNSAIYSNSLPRSHLPPSRLDDEEQRRLNDAILAGSGAEPTNKEGKGGKPPLIVFLPDGKGYVLPPFRDIQQVFTRIDRLIYIVYAHN